MSLFKNFKTNLTAQKLISNFTYLTFIEIIAVFLPLVSYPYLIRTVGPENYGIVVFAQAIVSYIIIIVNFGFNVSATRRISENRNDVMKLRQIYSSVIYSKSIIFFLCSILCYLTLKLLDYEYIYIVYCFWGLCIQEVLFPTWLYQGLEEMKFITIIMFFSKFSYLVLIFIFIHSADDFIFIPILYSIGGVLTSIASIYILKKKFNICFTSVSKTQMKEDFRESIPFFASRLSSVVMERTNVIAIGSFFSYEMVAIYDICTKIVSIAKTPFSLIAQVIYPNVARSKNMMIVKKITRPLFYVSLAVALLLTISSDVVIGLLGGDEMMGAAPILCIMAWYIPIVALSYLYGASVLVVKGHSKEYNISVVYSVIIYLILMCILFFNNLINLYTMTLTFILPELFVAFFRIYITKKNNLLNN